MVINFSWLARYERDDKRLGSLLCLSHPAPVTFFANDSDFVTMRVARLSLLGRFYVGLVVD